MLATMRSHFVSLGLVVLLAACAAPQENAVEAAASEKPQFTGSVVDLRAPEWRNTKVIQTSQGVVQHLGDDGLPEGLPGFLVGRIGNSLSRVGARSVEIKTTDVRLSLPEAQLDEVQTSTMVVMHGLVALPVVDLVSRFSRNKSASAVFCISVDGKDYLGNDSRLFRFGADEELRESIEAATAVLARNIESRAYSNSAACEAGWEGGQPRKQ